MTSRFLIKAAGMTERWSARAQWVVAGVSFAAVMSLDAVTGAQVSLAFLYFIVAGLAAWCFGERKGLLFAVLLTVGSSLIRHVQYDAEPGHVAAAGTQLWNAFARLMSTSMVVVLVSGMRTALQLERFRASTDGLTGVLNKASFNQRMTARIQSPRAADPAFILCYMDLDGFKSVNDQYGHSAGDDVLRLFAEGAGDALREDDLFARIGGDEFIALIGIPDIGDADHVAYLVHRRLTTILARTGLPVSCSMGALVATAAQLHPIEAAIQLADTLMYDVKRSGRNALRIGRIDPNQKLIAPNTLDIPSELVEPKSRYARSEAITADRRVA